MQIAFCAILALAVACSGTKTDADPQLGASDSTPASASATPSDSAASSAEVELRTDQSQYRPGAPVILTFVNHSASTFAFNPCTRVLERDASGTWTTVEEPARMCTMEAWMLAPNKTATANTELPATLAPGRYRVVVALTRDGQAPPGSSLQATSSPITITP